MVEPARSAESKPRPAAVLWDMDGTFVDTEPYWVEVERELVEAHGGTWTSEDAMQLVGNDLIESGRYIREHGGVDLPAEEIVEILLDGVVTHIQKSVPWRPGARELLASLRKEGVPCAMVTMSYERFVAPVLLSVHASLGQGDVGVLEDGQDIADRGADPAPVGLRLDRRLHR